MIFDSDERFWLGVRDIAQTSMVPILMTCKGKNVHAYQAGVWGWLDSMAWHVYTVESVWSKGEIYKKINSGAYQGRKDKLLGFLPYPCAAMLRL